MNDKDGGQSTVCVQVEFYGVPRRHAAAPRIAVALPSPAPTLRDLWRSLATTWPQWGEACLNDRGELLPQYLANLDGDAFVAKSNTPLRDGQTVLVLTADAGG